MKRVIIILLSSILLCSCNNNVVQKNQKESNLTEVLLENKSEINSNTLFKYTDSGYVPLTQDEIEELDKLNGINNIPSPFDNQIKHYAKEQETIETEYVTWIIEEDNYILDDLTEITDEICKLLEEISNLYYKEKITIYVKKEYNGGRAEYNYITLDNRCFFIDECNILVHELSHVLDFQNSNNYAENSFYSEGYADYMTYKMAEYTKEKGLPLYEMLNIQEKHKDTEIERGYLESNVKIYDKDIDYWLDIGICKPEQTSYDTFSDYYYGRIFMLYLEQYYDNAQTWIQFVCNPNDNYCDETCARTVAGYKRMMKYAYGEDVFDNFYPWVKENEEFINDFFYE